VTISLPRTPLLSVRPGYALVVPDYVRVYEEARRDSSIVSHIRKGGIVEIVRETQDGQWYRIRSDEADGWVEARYIRQYDSREQASNARRTFGEESP